MFKKDNCKRDDQSIVHTQWSMGLDDAEVLRDNLICNYSRAINQGQLITTNVNEWLDKITYYWKYTRNHS